MTAKKATTKKKLAIAELTPEALANTVVDMIGMSDHAPENEGREFTFVITNEIFKELGNPKEISFARFYADRKKFLEEFQEAFIPDFVIKDWTKHCPIHEVMEVLDETDDSVWLAVTMRIHSLLVTRSGRGFSYHRQVERAPSADGTQFVEGPSK